MTKKILIGCVTVLLILLCAGCQGNAGDNGGNSDESEIYAPTMLLPSPTPILPPHKVEYSTLNFKEIWRFDTGFPNAGQIAPPPGLYIANGKVAITFDIRDAGTPIDATLVSLWLENGQVAWQTYIKDPGSSIQSFHLDKETGHLYLLYGFKAHAFDLETGDKLWTTRDLGGHTGYVFTLEANSPLQLRSSRQELISIDPQTGEVLSREKNGEHYSTFYYNSLIINNDNNALTAVNSVTGQIAWKIDGWYFACWPGLIGEDMLLQTASRPCGNSAPSAIWHLHTLSGTLAWYTEQEYVSNYAVDENILYALHQDGRLVALDLDNGSIVGEMKFNYPANDPAVLGTFRSYWVAVEGPYVLVYFGDSQELIAFKRDH